MNTFSRGVPRNGQWVIVDGKLVGIAHKRDVKDESTGLRVPETWPSGKARIHFVDETGFGVTMDALVDITHMAPLLDKSLIPGPRLKTMDVNWSPSA